ncbi:MAG: hypothetical protein ACREK1_02870 [Longimicrobiales bacterium]
MMSRKLPWAEIIVIAAVLAAGAGVYLYAHRDEGKLEQSKQRGAELVQALDEYHSEHGTYPEQLEQLVPRHIDKVRPPLWGLRRWRYRRYATADAAAQPPAAVVQDSTEYASRVYFQLSVAAHESGYPVLYYDTEARRWVLNN